ncbi:SMI1/KNR4 family protein [Delftia sp. NA_296.1]|uniref:SMI1/KNR4 family protein n=1 Tax=Delftia sp. NA_296.1 TaxID=3415648 RepID=UPI0040465705
MASTIDTIMTLMSGRYHRDPPLEAETITDTSRRMNLPGDYTQWMYWSNGGEGDFGALYLVFWPLNEIVQLNREFCIQKYLGAKALCFATDGGRVGYVFRSLPNDCSVWSVPLGDLDWNAARKLGENLGSTLLESLNST